MTGSSRALATVFGLVIALAASAAGDDAAKAAATAAAAPPNSSVPPSASAQTKKTFDLAISSGKVQIAGDTIRARRGDDVELRWTSDRPMSLHLHGYDIEAKVAPQSPGVMTFKATIAGRFPVSEHRHGAGHERAILYLEVHPN